MAKNINADQLNLEEIVVRTNKVQKTTKGGRTLSWSILVAVGDKNGHVGIGLGKAAAVPDAIRKASEAAKKNIIKINIVNGTIPYECFEKFGASKVMLKPASKGTGVVAGGAVRPILELAGIEDVFGKILGSRNGVNAAKATMICLENLKLAEDVCATRQRDLEVLVPWYARIKKAESQGLESDIKEVETLEVKEGENA
ncbi:MAG: 30S ribosomal protein S5 [Abditibacteriota bacterium]|nr:30S ribosomal protein S5 [Abditibacteriota bacterium]